MLIEWLWELKESVDKHGIRVGLILTLFVIYRKELRNMRLDMRDEALFRNVKILMEQLGVGDQWVGQPKVSGTDLLNYKSWSLSLRREIQRGNLLIRRIKKMNQNINWWTLALSIFGTLKLVLQPFGIDLSHITDDQINSIINGIAALLAIYGVFATHRFKGDSAQEATTQPKPQLTDPDKFIQG